MALVAGGGYAEYVAVHMGCVLHIPEGISMVDTGGLQSPSNQRNLIDEMLVGIPEAFLTAYQGLRLIGNIKAGDAVLIHAGARYSS